MSESVFVPGEIAQAVRDQIYLFERDVWERAGHPPEYSAPFRHKMVVEMNVDGVPEFHSRITVEGRAVCNCSLGFHISADVWELKGKEIEHG